jgi:hypothetical protein
VRGEELVARVAEEGGEVHWAERGVR